MLATTEDADTKESVLTVPSPSVPGEGRAETRTAGFVS